MIDHTTEVQSLDSSTFYLLTIHKSTASNLPVLVDTPISLLKDADCNLLHKPTLLIYPRFFFFSFEVEYVGDYIPMHKQPFLSVAEGIWLTCIRTNYKDKNLKLKIAGVLLFTLTR